MPGSGAGAGSARLAPPRAAARPGYRQSAVAASPCPASPARSTPDFVGKDRASRNHGKRDQIDADTAGARRSRLARSCGRQPQERNARSSRSPSAHHRAAGPRARRWSESAACAARGRADDGSAGCGVCLAPLMLTVSMVGSPMRLPRIERAALVIAQIPGGGDERPRIVIVRIALGRALGELGRLTPRRRAKSKTRALEPRVGAGRAQLTGCREHTFSRVRVRVRQPDAAVDERPTRAGSRLRHRRRWTARVGQTRRVLNAHCLMLAVAARRDAN